jgi:hypothetical protein
MKVSFFNSLSPSTSIWIKVDAKFSDKALAEVRKRLLIKFKGEILHQGSLLAIGTKPSSQNRYRFVLTKDRLFQMKVPVANPFINR